MTISSRCSSEDVRMKGAKVFFVFLVIAVCVIQAGSALKVTNLEVTPSGNLKVGDAVTVHGIVNLGDTFPEDNYLEFYTQLDKATVQWEYAIGIDEKYPPTTTAGGQYLRIDGWLLSYPEDMSVSVQVTVDGVVPSTSGQLTVFRARQLDEDDAVVGTEVVKTVTVFNPEEIAAQITAMEGNLAALKASIDEKAAAGIAVGDAQTYYTAAYNAISSARSASSSGGDVTGNLNAAMTAINEANIALDRALSQQSIDKAQQTIDSVIGLYNEFTVNRSLKISDPRLVPITQKRDIAISTLSSAKDDQAAGSYASSRAKAVNANTLAEEAWTLSLALKEELDKGFSLNFNLGGLLLPIGIILIIVAGVGGVYYWKKYRTWDELG
jgi:hypothetical protein